MVALQHAVTSFVLGASPRGDTMSLTGPTLPWIVILLTLAVFGAVVAAWPRLAGRGPAHVAGRAGALLTVNVLVLLTAAVLLNNQFLFFAGWTDLGGAIYHTGTTTALHGGAATPATTADPTGPAAAEAPDPQPPPPGQRLPDGSTVYRVHGPLSGITGQILVSLPPGYAKTPGHRYPVLEAFTGYPAAITQWVKTMRLRSIADGQAAAHRLAPVLIVTPQIEVPAGTDTECVDGSPGQPQVETWVTRDVPDWIAAHFRVRAERSSWATIGLSTGGWCAAMATMLHPAQYGAAVVLGGYFRPEFGPAYQPYPPDSPAAQRYALITLIRRAPPPVALWVETSHADPLSYDTSRAVLTAARPPLSVTATVLRDAGHRIGIWKNLVPTTLTWLAATLPGFRP